jgi:hypothetical protein
MYEWPMHAWIEDDRERALVNRERAERRSRRRAYLAYKQRLKDCGGAAVHMSYNESREWEQWLEQARERRLAAIDRYWSEVRRARESGGLE